MSAPTHVSLGSGRTANARAKTKRSLPVQVGLAGEEGFPRSGKVDFVDVEVKPNGGTVQWRAVFANADGLLIPGMFARVRLTTSAPHKALLVPNQAVVGSDWEKVRVRGD